MSQFWFVIAGLVLLYLFAVVVYGRRRHGRWPAPSRGILPGETRHMLYEGFAATSAGPVFHMFGTSWCPHCTKAKPKFESLGSTMTIGGNDVALKYVDADDNKEMAAAYGVKGYPTFVLEKPDGTKVTHSGAREPEAFRAFLQQHLA